MVKVKVTINAKVKKSEEMEVSSRAQLIAKIEQIFNIDPATIGFMKPQIKDEDQFAKNVKENIEILFKGSQKKQLTEEQKKKKEQKLELQTKVLEEAKKKIQQMKIDVHKKALEKLNKQNIKERGFSYMNENGEIQKLHTDHYTSPVLLMRIVPEFKKFCSKYKVQPKNPDGLLIQQLGRVFKAIDGQPADRFVDPLDWCSAFIAYCADDIDYPYPTYDFNYIVHKILQTVQNAHITEAERKQPNATPSNFGEGNSMFALELNMKKTKLTQLDEDDFEYNKEMDKRQIRYVLECDLSSPDTKTVLQGIKKRFEQKNVWENFYAFDLEYKQKITSIQRPSKYLFVHMNRIGYPPSKDQSQQIVLLPTPKSTHRVRTKLILDLSDLCSTTLKQRLQNGKFERFQMFYRLGEQQEYQNFIEDLKAKNPGVQIDKQYSQNQLKYMYFDEKLFTNDIFHQYYFDQLKGSKQTGEYRIIGVIFHRGKYYHHTDSTHKKQSHGHDKKQCRGQFMVMVYNQGTEWLKFYETEVERVTLAQVLSSKYWGEVEGEWTPTLCLYREIYIKNIQIQIPDD